MAEPRIVLFGATGYTGRLTAEALVAAGAKPVLAGRSAARLDALAGELGGGLETAVADVDRPTTVRGLVSRGDVLVSTVGPFARWGDPAVQAAIAAGAGYLDSTGEPEFIRRVFERHGGGAEAAGSGLVTAFGYDFVPGNLAAALALERAGEAAVRVDVGYFFVASARATLDGLSGGTRASLLGAALAPGFAWRAGRLVTEPGGQRVRSFDVAGARRQGVSIGASEHLALPRIAPRLRDVDVYLGWAGPLSRAFQGFALANGVLTRIPGVASAQRAVMKPLMTGSSGGPDATARAAMTSHVVALASDGAGRELSEVHLAGVNGYDFTARVLSWGARRAAASGLEGTGALGPVEAFGLDALVAGATEAGLAEV